MKIVVRAHPLAQVELDPLGEHDSRSLLPDALGIALGPVVVREPHQRVGGGRKHPN